MCYATVFRIQRHTRTGTNAMKSLITPSMSSSHLATVQINKCKSTTWLLQTVNSGLHAYLQVVRM